jgi:probable FeS assembly SUF system protein SufT
MARHYGEPITLTRDCDATQIPSGFQISLPKGSHVQVAQVLGGNFTVMTDDNYLVRIAGKDGDALGPEYVGMADQAEKERMEGPYDEKQVWEQLKTVFDPEIPVNIVDLGLVYECKSTPLDGGGARVDVKMSMTAPGCGMGDVLKDDARQKILGVPGVKEVNVEVVWEPPWDSSRMSEAARLQLGWM